MPWKLLADPSCYIFTWLVGYSALLGPIGGILIADYFVWRRHRLSLPALYDPQGEYRYTGGFSVAGMTALFLSIIPNIPGFLAQINKWPASWAVPAFLVGLYQYAWFVGFGLAFVIYLVLRKISPKL